ncbi:hypothetical protein OSH11_04680 [Kaistia dalseonensis]|uniref:Anti-sigma factor RsiW n=1 Tax=Kaistia dalseonensis TaxID=410840 RepID=A0ABU0H2N9_9HYPH|nr:hypothetical protein [Kaistia dalseonensis]MCX5493984.1 hypothetical protein [Kaistia dalseonensis]MDQ0436560.1 anti-sigma factor RsiW [Kaistia dalseonensis]
MNDADRHPDEELVAFLDDELASEKARDIVDAARTDSDLRERLAFLDSGGRLVLPALDAILDAAPHERLQGLLAAAIARQADDPVPIVSSTATRPSPWQRLGWGQLAAAAAVLLVIGGATGGLIASNFGPADQTEVVTVGHENWRQAVAEYWLLTTADTLAIAPTPDVAREQLALAGRGLGLDLDKAAAPPPALSFRGAQLFDFQGRPLTQIAYIDPDHGPIAYCIIKTGNPKETGLTDETLDGFNIVHWASGGHSRMLIGRAPPETLRAYAEQFAASAG